MGDAEDIWELALTLGKMLLKILYAIQQLHCTLVCMLHLEPITLQHLPVEVQVCAAPNPEREGKKEGNVISIQRKAAAKPMPP